MIDEIKLRKDIYTAFCDNCTYASKLCCDNNCKIHQVIRIIDMQSQLSIDTETVKHAQWIWDSNAPHREHGAYRCSNCGCYSDFGENYCFNCGYKMNGGTEND